MKPDKAMIAEETPWQPNDTTLQILHLFPQIKQVQAFATKSAVVEKNKEIEGVLFKGVESNYDFNNLKSFLKQGVFQNLMTVFIAKTFYFLNLLPMNCR